MNWQQVCSHPSLKNLPFKIELNERGQIIMSPVKLYHSFYQGEIGNLLRSFLEKGKILMECAIRTRKGTKVADVAWVSEEKFQKIKHETDSPIAPKSASRYYPAAIPRMRSERNGNCILRKAQSKFGIAIAMAG